MAAVLVVRMRTKEGEEERVLEHLRTMEQVSRREPGCLTYDVHRDVEDRRVFLIYERYVDRAALDTHWASDHYREHIVGGISALLDEVDRSLYVPIGG